MTYTITLIKTIRYYLRTKPSATITLTQLWVYHHMHYTTQPWRIHQQTVIGSGRIHYNDVIMIAMACEITGLRIVYSSVCSGAYQRKQFRLTGLCAGNSQVTGEFPAQRAVMRKMFPFDDVIMKSATRSSICYWRVCLLAGITQSRNYPIQHCRLGQSWPSVTVVPTLAQHTLLSGMNVGEGVDIAFQSWCKTVVKRFCFHLRSGIISMAKCKIAAYPVRQQWRYCSLALSQRHNNESITRMGFRQIWI